MYRHIAFNEVSANFSAHFGMSISPYFNRIGSNKTSMLEFLTHKFVRYLMKNKGYEGAANESLELFIRRKYDDRTWNFLKRLM